MAHPKVSVIIPSYNCARYLPDAIDSVTAQTYANYELIVVDDGSTDDTSQVVARYCGQVQYICQENRGVASARNAGIGCAHGDYVIFLDADDLLLPDKLQMQATFLDQHPDVDIVYSDGLLFRINSHGVEVPRLLSACGLLNKSLGTAPVSLPILAIQNAFPPLCAMARLRCVREIGGFDEARSLMTTEDWDLWYRLAEKFTYGYLDAVLVKYRDWEGSTSKDWHRRKSAFMYMIPKFEASDGFANIPTRARSSVFFFWGVMYLEYREPEMAIRRFRSAIELDAGNLYARSAFLLTRLLGHRAVFFFHLKRRLFGTRRLPGS